MAHLLATFRGTLGPANGALEQWSFGLRFGGTAYTTKIDSQQQIADELRAKFAAAMPGLNFLDHVGFDEVRTYLIDDATGRATAAPVTAGGTEVRGTATTNRHPWQVSLAVTLDAGFPKAGRYGRFYLPPQGYGLQPDGRIHAGDRDSVADAISLMLNDMNDPSGPDAWGLRIYSRKSRQTRLVQEIRVGRAFDTQRSRRSDLPEEYAVRAVS